MVSIECDTAIQSYSDSSMHTTSAQGATATINFSGMGFNFFLPYNI
jgi:hypothetical protein